MQVSVENIPGLSKLNMATGVVLSSEVCTVPSRSTALSTTLSDLLH